MKPRLFEGPGKREKFERFVLVFSVTTTNKKIFPAKHTQTTTKREWIVLLHVMRMISKTSSESQKTPTRQKQQVNG